ncbi:MAG: hypothetical protein AB1567_04035 [bacterium]
MKVKNVSKIDKIREKRKEYNQRARQKVRARRKIDLEFDLKYRLEKRKARKRYRKNVFANSLRRSEYYQKQKKYIQTWKKKQKALSLSRRKQILSEHFINLEKDPSQSIMPSELERKTQKFIIILQQFQSIVNYYKIDWYLQKIFYNSPVKSYQQLLYSSIPLPKRQISQLLKLLDSSNSLNFNVPIPANLSIPKTAMIISAHYEYLQQHIHNLQETILEKEK